MPKPCLLRFSVAALLFFCSFAKMSAACVDSILLHIQPVQCYGLRNGLISVDTVFGGERPFYYSMDGQTFSTRPEFDRLWAGTYTVYVRDASGCVKSWEVEVPQPEELLVSLTADASSVEAGKPVQLRAEVWPKQADIVAIEWRPPFLFNNQTSLEQIVHPVETTVFAIEVRDQRDCIARQQVTVEVTKTSLYFPNIIKPTSNNDDYFTVFAGEGVSQIVQMRVYDRSGGLVFERSNFPPNDPIKGWNGKWKGRRVQAGTYVWVAVVEYLNGQRKQFSGAVTVVY